MSRDDRGGSAHLEESRSAGEPATLPRGPLTVIAIALAVGLAAVAVGGLAWTAMTRSQESSERTEAQELRAALLRVKDTIEPIARDYASASPTAPIDVEAYRRRVDRARAVVIAVNDVAVVSGEGLQLRDDILTGGATVLEGMNGALDALQSDDASAAATAGGRVEEGMALLLAAEDSLDERIDGEE